MVSSHKRHWSFGGALLALTLALGALPAGAAYASSFAVTARATRTTLTLAAATHVKGKVSPARPGRRVTLQQKHGRSWTTLASTKLSGTSTYDFTVKPASAGVAAYRVVKAGQGGRAAGVSPTVRVGVYRWHYVVDLRTVDKQAVEAWDVDAAITGLAYRRSVLVDADSGDGDPGGWFRTDVRGKCSKFRAQLGSAAGNPAGSAVGVQVSATGSHTSQSFTTSLGLGDALQATLPIDGTDLLEVRGVPVGDVDGAALAVGSPRVLCRF